VGGERRREGAKRVLKKTHQLTCRCRCALNPLLCREEALCWYPFQDQTDIHRRWIRGVFHSAESDG
jgi:hypothetical protein